MRRCRYGYEAASGCALKRRICRGLFPPGPLEALAANLNVFMFDDRKANGGESRLRHQAGMDPKPRFVRSEGLRFDLRE